MTSLMFGPSAFLDTVVKFLTQPPLPKYSFAGLCLQSSAEEMSPDQRDQYEQLAEERRRLKRRLKELGQERTQTTQEARSIQARIEQIDMLLS